MSIAGQFGLTTADGLMPISQLSADQARWFNDWGIRTVATQVPSRRTDGSIDYDAGLGEVLGSLANDMSVPVEIEVCLLTLSQNLSGFENAARFSAGLVTAQGGGIEKVYAFMGIIFGAHFDLGRFILNLDVWRRTHPAPAIAANPVKGSLPTG